MAISSTIDIQKITTTKQFSHSFPSPSQVGTSPSPSWSNKLKSSRASEVSNCCVAKYAWTSSRRPLSLSWSVFRIFGMWVVIITNKPICICMYKYCISYHTYMYTDYSPVLWPINRAALHGSKVFASKNGPQLRILSKSSKSPEPESSYPPRHMFVVDEGPELLPVDTAGAFDVHLPLEMAKVISRHNLCPSSLASHVEVSIWPKNSDQMTKEITPYIYVYIYIYIYVYIYVLYIYIHPIYTYM